MELMGHLDVDWDGSGSWRARPTTVVPVEGSGGNALVTGGRTDHTWMTLEALQRTGAAAGLKKVTVREDHPSSWYVAVRSPRELGGIAAELDARLDLNPAKEIIKRFGTVAEHVGRARTDLAPSGFRALRFDVDRLRFQDLNESIRWGDFPPGCYEQRSRGRNRYIFVAEDRSPRVVDRWVAIHAELDRQRRAGEHVPETLWWDRRTERMASLAAAQLPTPLARAAVLCSGLPPRRSTSGRWTDTFEGVNVRLYAGICEAVHHPHPKHNTDLTTYDKDD